METIKEERPELKTCNFRTSDDTRQKLKLVSALKHQKYEACLNELLSTELAFLTKGGIEL